MTATAILWLAGTFHNEASATQVPARVTVGWIFPTLNVDGSAVTDPITVNVYAGAKGAEVLVTSGLSTTSTVIAGVVGQQICAFVTAVENNVESSHSLEVCETVPFPSPNPPSGVTIQ